MNHRFENSPLWESCDYLEGEKKKKEDITSLSLSLI